AGAGVRRRAGGAAARDAPGVRSGARGRADRPRRARRACGARAGRLAREAGRLSDGRPAGSVRAMNSTPQASWTLRGGGGSRGNPGPGAYGFVLCDPAGREVQARGEFLGVCTNNVAEYRALIAGLQAAARHGVRSLAVQMDSELVVRQM